jgi:hypothetical protein
VSAAMLTKGQAPTVSREPGVLLGCMTECHRTRTGRERAELTRYPGRIDEGMPL